MGSNDGRSPNHSYGIPEFLPNLNKFVDLSDPESMSRDELLEVFKRRGFQMLVSKFDPIDHIVNLYYDHIMPMPARSKFDLETSETNLAPLGNNVAGYSLTANPLQYQKKVKSPETSLENIIITNDLKRLTPGTGPIPNSKDERTLTVKLPKQIVRDRLKRLDQVGDVCPSSDAKLNGTQSVPPGTTCNDGVPKKRAKLNRDFKELV